MELEEVICVEVTTVKSIQATKVPAYSSFSRLKKGSVSFYFVESFGLLLAHFVVLRDFLDESLFLNYLRVKLSTTI